MEGETIFVPAEAAEWIAAKIHTQHVLPEYLTSGRGLMVLTMRSMTHLWELLRSMHQTGVAGKLPKKKRSAAQRLARCFYVDHQRKQANKVLMQTLLADARNPVQNRNLIQQGTQPTGQPCTNFLQGLYNANTSSGMLYNSIAPMIQPNHGSTPNSQAIRTLNTSIPFQPNPLAQNQLLRTSQQLQTFPSSPQNKTQYPTTQLHPVNSASKHKQTKVKTESGEPDTPVAVSPNINASPVLESGEGTPKNDHESKLLSQLQQMGFTDSLEILSCAREMAANTPGRLVSADEIMMTLVIAREEAEEARKMDEARLQSERTRKEESARLRKENEIRFEKRLSSAPLSELLSNSEFFPRSWILKHATKYLQQIDTNMGKETKQKLLRLLKLEKLTGKWYGRKLPTSYFEVVLCGKIEKCKAKCSKDLNQLLDKEAAILEKGMYTLSEQDGGVPKILLVAHDRHGSEVNQNDDDEDIVVVTRRRPVEESLQCTNKRRKQESPPEVIVL